MVEHLTENPRVASPILALGTSSGGSSSVVECLLAKEEVASSNLVFRSIYIRRRCQVVKAGVCKTPIQRFESARRLHLFPQNAGVAELADAEDLKSSEVKLLWVRDPPPAPVNY